MIKICRHSLKKSMGHGEAVVTQKSEKAPSPPKVNTYIVYNWYSTSINQTWLLEAINCQRWMIECVKLDEQVVTVRIGTTDSAFYVKNINSLWVFF